MDVPSLLRKYISKGATVLDIGCGAGSPFSKANLIEQVYLTGVDSHQGALDAVRQAGYRDTIQGSLPDAISRFSPDSFDFVTALDVIEHLPHELGLRLASIMKDLARTSSIIVTPYGFLPQEATDENEAQRHLSGWLPEDFVSLGYTTFVGLNGWRPLRGPYGQPTVAPTKLGSALARLSSPLVEKHPNHAFQFAAISGPSPRQV